MNFRRLVTTFLILPIISICIFTGSIVAQVADQIDLKGHENSSKSKIKSVREKDFADPGTSELITSVTYPFTAGTAALEDMSSGTTNLVGASADDTASALTNIGFDFWMDGVRHTQFSANANGLMKLGSPVVNNGANGRTNNFATANDLPKIAAYWDDLCTSATGRVHFKVIGTPGSRKLIVEWQNMVTFGTSCATGLTLGTWQVWLTESSDPTLPGTIQFVYGAIGANSATNGGYSNGIGSSATSFASITTAADTVSYAASANAQVNTIAASKSYLFTPLIPAAPTGGSVTGATAVSQQVNWTDNAANEVGYVLYRSTDNVTFTFLTQTAANATSFVDTSLTPSTLYFYRVYAVSEGALSAVLATSGTTGAPGNDTCNGAGGNWDNVATWTDGSVPTATDNVTIGSGCTVTVNVTNAVALNVTVDAGGTLQSPTTGAVTNNNLTVGQNVTNNGTLDFSTNGDTSGAILTFGAGVTNATFGGSGATTDIRAITVAKGALATTVELLTTNFTVQGVNTDVAGYLTITSGTFKISGNFTMTNRTFASATYTIPALGGFWLNNPNYTIVGQAGGTTTQNNGLLRMTQGVYNIGVGGGDGMGGGTGAQFIIEGGTINATRIDPQNAVTWNMSAGTINISPTVGNTRSNFGSFELFSAASSFTMSGGTINLIQAATGATPIDWQVVSGTLAITGGTVNVGTGATATNFNFRIRGTTPNIVVDNTTNPKTATFTAQTLIRGNSTITAGSTMNLGGFLVAPTAEGGVTRTFTNNGTLTGNTAGSRLYFLGQGAGSGHVYTGTGIAGTTALPLLSVDFDSVNGVSLGGAANNLITNRVIMFTGSVTGASKLELGVGGASTGVVQIGNTTTPTAAGTFDVPFTFNLGTGGQTASYLRTTTSYTTGGEVNPARTYTTMAVDNNVTSLNIAGGNLTVTGAMTLTNGTVFTGNSNVLVHNGTATRTNGFVDGNLGRDYTAAGTYTYFVGQGAHTPVLVNVTAVGGAGASRLTARSFNATLAGFNPPTSLSRNWSLEETGDITADLSFTYDTDANDVNGNEADYRVYSRNSANVVTNHCTGGPCVNTATNTLGPILGISTFSRWTGGENQIATAANASISGQVRTQAGNGIRNATVIISGGNLTQPIMGQTGAFGYYQFDNLAVGQAYMVEVVSKRFHIPNATRTLVLQDNLTNIDFVSEENPKSSGRLK